MIDNTEIFETGVGRHADEKRLCKFELFYVCGQQLQFSYHNKF